MDTNQVFIDFSIIGEESEFYSQLKEKLTLPDYFGDNLDALHDSISSEVKLPLHIEFVNMSVDQLETFEGLIETLEDLEEEVDDFEFSYFLEQYSDED
ncbi:barstar family protein [Chryseobacterium sp. A301]